MSPFCGRWGSPSGNVESLLRGMLGATPPWTSSPPVEFATRGELAMAWVSGGAQPLRVHSDDDTLAVCSGSFVPSGEVDLGSIVRGVPAALDALDGAFAFAHWQASTHTLTLGRDPFGARSLYWVRHAGSVLFATDLAQLLAHRELPLELDAAAVHKYLTFSFVPGAGTPIAGVRRILPGELLQLTRGSEVTRRYFQLAEQDDTTPPSARVAARLVHALGRKATAQRVTDARPVGVYLSGGLDSAAVAVWLNDSGADPRAFSLDFGAQGVEKAEAQEVARALALPQTWVHVSGADVARVFESVVAALDLPFGDPVTVPQYLLGEAARQAGLSSVFNGEGGDQLFGGWTTKPMIAAAVYGGLYASDATSPEETYLQSYHRFYGLENELYTPEFQARVGPAGQRRALLTPYLRDGAESFLTRIRLADVALKGAQNIVPRASRMASAWGLELHMPLFDRRLATHAFRLPPELKLHGACEKYVLKLAMQKRLPEAIVWRKKLGMSVPVTDFVFSPAMAPLVDQLLGDAAVRARGWFRPAFVKQLREGQALPGDLRRRRVGERLWALMMLEAWMQRFVDRRGS